MKKRTIMIRSTREQKAYKLENVEVSTLGELKALLDEKGIEYNGMDFTEGFSNTTLNSDDSQLPSQVMFKGKVTNNLAILLTNTKKNIASGCDMSRKEIYDYIKEHNLQDDIKDEFGTNYTTIKSDLLEEYINTHTGREDEIDNNSSNANEAVQELTHKFSVPTTNIISLMTTLVEHKILDAEQLGYIRKAVDIMIRGNEDAGITMDCGDEVVTIDDLDEMIDKIM